MDEFCKQKGCSRCQFYNFIRDNGLKIFRYVTKKCQCCNEEYKCSARVAIIRKWCSSRCRSEIWRKENPEQFQMHQDKYRENNPPPCRICGRDIPSEKRKHGVTFCSDVCRKKASQQSSERSRQQKRDTLWKYKEKQGCSKCGYNKFGGSLDFHHLDPSTKKFSIVVSRWASDSLAVEEEIKKCVLLCKNCHYELEHDKHNKGE